MNPMKNLLSKLSSAFCQSRRLHEQGDSGRYYRNNGYTFWGSVGSNGAVRDGRGNVRGHVQNGKFRRS